ncbi:LADA_0F08482g1_1 [Lachancea dasiensis]|uniref:LADA_0F08482g1_1 n=1 Tax=Lachancea dasiensis TaxID=1072105 RepID=A0A1G4JKS5_9SACH|nr:LADA_0F08482g1_1 [Lachancea dasiensis]
MSKQRVISESTGLYRLSIVNKQKDSPGSSQEDESRSNQESPKKGLLISSPVKSRLRMDTDGVASPETDSKESHKFSERLLYDLAAKRRQVVELKQELIRAEKELDVLQRECEDFGKMDTSTLISPEKFQMLTSKLQQTIEDVNCSPKVIKSKQSISNFFQQRSNPNGTDNKGLTEKPSRLRLTANKFQNLSRKSPTQSPFLDKLINKWQDFSVSEQDEEKFDTERPTDNFYIKSKFDYDEDEEISSETESDSGSKMSDLGNDPVLSTFKRNSETV